MEELGHIRREGGFGNSNGPSVRQLTQKHENYFEKVARTWRKVCNNHTK